MPFLLLHCQNALSGIYFWIRKLAWQFLPIPDEDPLSATSGSKELSDNADAVSAPQSSKSFEVLLEVVTDQ